MDEFFKKNNCDRCGTKLITRIMSIYNEDVICMDCKEKERNREDYKQARDVEANEVMKGNHNFKGIGLK